jgi:hypothetical protein
LVAINSLNRTIILRSSHSSAQAQPFTAAALPGPLWSTKVSRRT